MRWIRFNFFFRKRSFCCRRPACSEEGPLCSVPKSVASSCVLPLWFELSGPQNLRLCLWLLLGELQLLQDKGAWWCNWCCGHLPLPGLPGARLRLLPDRAPELSWGRWRKGCVLRSCSDLGLGSRLGSLVAYVDVKLCATKCFCIGCLVSLLSLPSVGSEKWWYPGGWYFWSLEWVLQMLAAVLLEGFLVINVFQGLFFICLMA